MTTQTRGTTNMTIYTIGHSTRSIDAFIAILQTYGIKMVVDIRTIPKSRHNPQFNSTTLQKALRKHRIGYMHSIYLGGLRHTHKDSINTAWENVSFRGFADYMQTAQFTRGISNLIQRAEKRATVIMCAEAVPWRCHRSLVGDALLVRHIDVEDIYNRTNAKPHTLTPWAKVEGTTITYPGKQ